MTSAPPPLSDWSFAPKMLPVPLLLPPREGEEDEEDEDDDGKKGEEKDEAETEEEEEEEACRALNSFSLTDCSCSCGLYDEARWPCPARGAWCVAVPAPAMPPSSSPGSSSIPLPASLLLMCLSRTSKVSISPFFILVSAAALAASLLVMFFLVFTPNRLALSAIEP